MNSTLLLSLVLAGLAAAIVLLVVLLRKASGSPDHAAMRAELDRATRLLQEEQVRSREQASETGQLNGRLGALETALTEEREASATLRRALSQLQAEAEAARSDVRSARQSLEDREQALAELRTSSSTLETALASTRDELRQLHAKHSEAIAHLEHARQANTDMKAFLSEAQTRLSGAFSELAGKVFEEKGQLFERNISRANLQSRADIESLLKPFSERIGEFRGRVEALYGDEAKERATLLGAVTELKSLNQEMATEAAALTRALKGSSKVRGDWGELMLESVLRGSGLEEGVHYERQKSAVGEDGARLQPDILVRLPDERCVVIDSKVNLVAWQEAMNSDAPGEQQEAMRRHAIGLRQHMKELSEKNYPKAIGDTALDVTIAFIPIEGALSAALGTDHALQSDAFDRRVVFASPNTLMALLRVVERLWTRDKVQREAIAISDSGGKVLDALMSFLADFDAVGKKLSDASDSFKKARNRLSESNQAVIPRARRLAELGARGRKALTPELKVEASAGTDNESVGAIRLIGKDEPEGS